MYEDNLELHTIYSFILLDRKKPLGVIVELCGPSLSDAMFCETSASGVGRFPEMLSMKFSEPFPMLSFIRCARREVGGFLVGLKLCLSN